MSQQHVPFEEEPGGESSYQMGYLDPHLTPSAGADLPGQKHQAGGLAQPHLLPPTWTVYALSWHCFR